MNKTLLKKMSEIYLKHKFIFLLIMYASFKKMKSLNIFFFEKYTKSYSNFFYLKNSVYLGFSLDLKVRFQNLQHIMKFFSRSLCCL